MRETGEGNRQLQGAIIKRSFSQSKGEGGMTGVQ